MRKRGELGVRSLAAAVVAALVCAGVASGADVGANDDTGKFAPDAGAAFYTEMAALGLRQTVVTVRWQPSDPLALAERPLLDLTVAAARVGGALGRLRDLSVSAPRGRGRARAPGGVRRVARRARAALPRGAAVRRRQRAQSAGLLAPAVRAAASSSPRRSFGPFLAAGYDALKDVDQTLTVVGSRALAPWERPSHGQEQCVDLSRPVPGGARGLVPGSWPAAAADGRPQLPSLPERGDRPVRVAATRGRTPASSTSTGSGRRSGTHSPARPSRRPSTGSGCTSTRWAGRSTRPVATGTWEQRTSRSPTNRRRPRSTGSSSAAPHVIPTSRRSTSSASATTRCAPASRPGSTVRTALPVCGEPKWAVRSPTAPASTAVSPGGAPHARSRVRSDPWRASLSRAWRSTSLRPRRLRHASVCSPARTASRVRGA